MSYTSLYFSVQQGALYEVNAVWEDQDDKPLALLKSYEMTE